MALVILWNESCSNGKILAYYAVAVVMFALLFGCACQGDIHIKKNVSDKLLANEVSPIPSDASITDSGLSNDIRSIMKSMMTLDSARKRYKDLFGNEPHISKLEYAKDTLSAYDQIVLIEYALRHNEPKYNNNKEIRQEVLTRAKYESRFGRTTSLICQFTSDVCLGPLPQYYTLDNSCDRYMDYLFGNSLRNGIPIIEDTVIITKLDLWHLRYCGGETGTDLDKCSFPSRFQKYSDEDKVRLLEFAISRPKLTFDSDVDMMTFDRSYLYLSSDREAYIKTTLNKIIEVQQEKLGRDMTELEMAHAEFEILYRRVIPDCEECTNDELLNILKFMTQMYTPYIRRVNRCMVEALLKRINDSGNRKMTAAEMIAAELEFFAGNGKRINCPQCTDDDLYILNRKKSLVA